MCRKSDTTEATDPMQVNLNATELRSGVQARHRIGLSIWFYWLCAVLWMAGSGEARGGSFASPARDSEEMAWWRDSMKTHDSRLEWWRAARFGMFVHWGVYSGLGGTWQGQPVKGYAEHIQRMLKIPIPTYRREVAGKFNPEGFDADQWILAAKGAGMGYFVITAKHHDGFAMFDSRASAYNIMQATPFKRDPMKELKAACSKYGLKFGFYYSHAFDWGDADAPGNDWDYDNPGGDRGLHGGRNWWDASPQLVPKARKYVDEKAIPQLLELIRQYDPDILWFDTPHKLPDSENVRVLKAVRQAKPSIVINGRLARGLGDYDSTADRPAEFSPHLGDWEGIPTTNESYGWNQNDHSHKPAGHFIQLLAKAAARGGNLLMNIGPRGDGRFDAPDVEILRGIGRWWKVNGESIRGTSRTPLAVQAWGETTVKGNTVYLHVFDWPAEGRLTVGGLSTPVKRAYLLSDPGKAALVYKRAGPLDVSFEVPRVAPDANDSVVAVECTGPIESNPVRLLQPALPRNTLRAFDAELRGRGLRFGPGKTRDAWVQNWTNQTASIVWPVRLNVKARFEVIAQYDADASSAGNIFKLTSGSVSLEGAVNPGVFKFVTLGQIELDPGPHELRIEPEKLQGGELMKLRQIELRALPTTTGDVSSNTVSGSASVAADVAARDRQRILNLAAAALGLEPITITRYRAELSQGGLNDFYSNGDYWWPDPSKADGLPYIQRDGQSNPKNFSEHRRCVMQLRDAVAALAAAYKVTGEERYAAKAAELLRVFFVDPKTRMNPHLKYAQAIPGRSAGRGIGIIDTLHLVEVPIAIRALQGSPPFSGELETPIKKWFAEYAEWMLTSTNGQEEARAGNNHAVAFWLQIAAFCDFTGDQARLAECRRQFEEVFVAKQMAKDGSFPAELRRTKPYAYSIFQLDNLATLCQLISTSENNLWDFQTADGRGMRLAMEFLYPYLEDKSKWPRQPDVQAWEGWPVRQPCLLFAGTALHEPKFIRLWGKLAPDPTDAEVRRNMAITQPLLWVR